MIEKPCDQSKFNQFNSNSISLYESNKTWSVLSLMNIDTFCRLQAKLGTWRFPLHPRSLQSWTISLQCYQLSFLVNPSAFFCCNSSNREIWACDSKLLSVSVKEHTFKVIQKTWGTRSENKKIVLVNRVVQLGFNQSKVAETFREVKGVLSNQKPSVINQNAKRRKCDLSILTFVF